MTHIIDFGHFHETSIIGHAHSHGRIEICLGTNKAGKSLAEDRFNIRYTKRRYHC